VKLDKVGAAGVVCGRGLRVQHCCKG
jgi:hypothetical protein